MYYLSVFTSIIKKIAIFLSFLRLNIAIKTIYVLLNKIGGEVSKLPGDPPESSLVGFYGYFESSIFKSFLLMPMYLHILNSLIPSDNISWTAFLFLSYASSLSKMVSVRKSIHSKKALSPS